MTTEKRTNIRPEKIELFRWLADSFLLLGGAKPDFELNAIELDPGVSLRKVDGNLLAELENRGVVNAKDLKDYTLCISSSGTSSTEDLMKGSSFADSLILATDVELGPELHIIINRDSAQLDKQFAEKNPLGYGRIFWGHFRHSLTMEDLKLGKRIWPNVAKAQPHDNFSRVSNALMFYMNGYNSNNADQALIGFTTCLESLFSTSDSEIAFRLSLRLATFLSDKPLERKSYFEEGRQVYRVRSRILHGAPIHREMEQAAIYLVEHVVPLAEGLARHSLNRVFTLGLEPIFNNPERVNELFDRLLFEESLAKTLTDMKITQTN